LQKPSKPFIAIASLFGVLFFLGLGHLFMLRFQAGDIYPPYSSLRADPLGTRALYQSLADTGSIDVRRHYQAASRISSGNDLTLFYLGCSAASFFSATHLSANDFNPQLERLTRRGARVVVSFIPPKGKNAPGKKASEKDNTDTNHPKPPESGTTPPDKALIWKPLQNVTLKYDSKLEKSDGAHLAPAYRTSGLPHQKKIPWHSAWYFDVAISAWRVIYSINDRPVMIEYPSGHGTVILLTDTFLLSNEALRNKRHPRFLAWLMGSNSQAVFDEAHLGMREKPGVVALARQNRLHWPIGGIILLAVLFIWKNAVPLTPPPAETAESLLHSDGSTSSDRDSTQGLISLLGRHIGKRQVLKIYVDQWRQSLPHNRMLTDARDKRIKAMFDADGALTGDADPVAAYRQIYAIISADEPNDKQA